MEPVPQRCRDYHIMTRTARIVPVSERTEVPAAVSDGRQLVVFPYLLLQGTIAVLPTPRPSPADAAVASRTHSWRRQIVWLIYLLKIVRLMPNNKHFNQVIFYAQFITATWSGASTKANYSPFYSHTRSKHTLLPTPACAAPSAHVAGWHSVVRLVPGLV